METKKLPIYNMLINDDDESSVSFVALVDDPATQRNWFAFKEQKIPISVCHSNYFFRDHHDPFI